MKYAIVGLWLIATVGCDEPARCEERSRAPIADSNAPLAIGGTYDDALNTIVGQRSGPLRWLDQSVVSGFPPAGEASITVTVHEPTAAWAIEVERTGGGTERLYCPNRLDAELQVDLLSDDGVLSAGLAVSFAFEGPETATMLLDISEASLGALEWDPIDPENSLFLRLDYRVGSAATGSLELQSERARVPTVLATWAVE